VSLTHYLLIQVCFIADCLEKVSKGIDSALVPLPQFLAGLAIPPCSHPADPD
jgi:hypothetical protein